MKPEFAFIAERALARHCPELLRRGPDHSHLKPLFARVGERLARRLAGALAPLLGGEAPLVRCSELRMGTIATLRDSAAAPLAANSLFGIGASLAPLLVAIDAEGVFRIVDRAFGGKGVAPRPLPEGFPMAAELMIARLETIVAVQITAAIDAVTDGAAAMSGPRAITPQRRDGSLAQLAPFAEEAPLALLALEVKEDNAPAWTMSLALPETALPALFGVTDGAARKPRAGAPRDGEIRSAIGELPLTLSARIVDMVVPFATVSALAPGQILPVTVARSIPLRIGDRTIGHGTIGAVDDGVALQLTSAFSH